MVFKNLCILVLWTNKVAPTLEGSIIFKEILPNLHLVCTHGVKFRTLLLMLFPSTPWWKQLNDVVVVCVLVIRMNAASALKELRNWTILGVYLPNCDSSPRSLPCLIMDSPNTPSGWGYRVVFAWPRILERAFILVSLAREAAREEKSHHEYTNTYNSKQESFNPFMLGGMVLASRASGQGLSRNASSVSFGHAEHCFLTVWTPKILWQNLLKMTFLRR